MRLVLRPPRWWWIAMAHDHERRREAALTLRLAMACDLPIYGLGDEWQGSRDVRIGFCHATFRRRPFGLRVQEGPVVVDELTALHEAPDGGTLSVTSHRRGRPEVDRARLVNSFLSISWVIDHREPSKTDWRAELTPEVASRPRLAASPSSAEWCAFEVRVDGAAARFERLSIAGHWLALGTMGEQPVSIEGHGLQTDDLSLLRVADLSLWVRRPDAPPNSRSIVELGDRLGDLLGLP